MRHKKYSKEDAIKAAKEMIKSVNVIEDFFGMTLNSDTNLYLNFKTNEAGKVWDYVRLGWDGDGTPLKVIEEEKMRKALREQALAKLSQDEREVLGL